MGLVGSRFTGGTAMLGFLLAAEVIAATAVVSEAALIYVARKRNMVISLVMLAMEAGLAAALILIMRDEGLPRRSGDRPGDRLVRGVGFASITKSWLLKRKLGEPVSGWRWSIAWAAAAGVGSVRRPAVSAAAAAADRGFRRSSPRSARSCGPRASGPRTASCSA